MQQNGRIVSKCYLPAITGNRLQDLTFTRWDELAAVFDPRGGHTCGPAAAKADMSTRVLFAETTCAQEGLAIHAPSLLPYAELTIV
ncbi:hypothetical protein JEQ12_013824 [Ovis aries]|uniref:Uncharacterized protein n=1 Tax=Ovis aries TaxID=9940 RepID=A0A836AJ28_SHEEP|nr:hypothetical protein JEQ12_013824 [Ovis aries]